VLFFGGFVVWGVLALLVVGELVAFWLFYSFLSQRCLDGQRVFIGHCLHRGSLALQYFLPCEISSTCTCM